MNPDNDTCDVIEMLRMGLYEKLNEKYAKWNISKCKKKIYVVLKGVHFFIKEVKIGASEVSWALPQTPRFN